ncbi:hypothetical protein CDL12_07297 [Handroanthus impetiginosus]|uniref:PGG domain-containing protein n=1 Tax=Handroanthus impetiginosus TaxID=429701 RepID=A0A2G9HR70_9LAMI|nr:hypothetical protein CDL12_07297 [Handroanthus impetiginosus]
MVVAVLIATMAFQAGMSPAGGVWQEDSDAHRAGEAVMSRNHPKAYDSFVRFNVIAFLSSLTSILLLISGLPLIRRRLFMWILVPIMWLTVTSIAVTYAISIVMVTPEKQRRYSSSHVIEIHGLAIWSGGMGVLLVGSTIQFIDWWLKNKGIIVLRPGWFRDLVRERVGRESV